MAEFLLIIGSVFLAAVGQITLKYGMNKVGRITAADFGNVFELFMRTFTNPFVLLGFLVFGLSSILWLVVLSRINVSVAYPFVSLTYFLVLLLSWLFLGEKITLLQWGGVMLIWLGLFVVTR